MKITEFSASSLRNLKDFKLTADENVNVIFGENAQGKTNILEGMWLFSGMRSFRGAKDKEIINFDSSSMSLQVNFFAGMREHSARIFVEEKKHLTLNGIKENNFKKISEFFKIIIFSPVHLSLIKDGPVVRRNFIDDALCQLKAGYRVLVTEYTKALTQRNALLKDARHNSSLIMLLEIWEERLCYVGARIVVQRKKYIEQLMPYLKEIFNDLSSGREEISLRYCQNECGEGDDISDIQEKMLVAMRKMRHEDFISLSTCVGPHRDDLIIEINGKSARSFGSQGQQRSCALALKLAEARLLEKITGESPVILLDDVMSELDAGRQRYIFNNIEKNQVFITCCEPPTLLKDGNCKIFEVRNGEIF
ncbi:MAG: DNA replication/repair protein RecF [Clostridia bacterium]|nr:DNA replication/repair protein RecF [Clostridia bacterium]